MATFPNSLILVAAPMNPRASPCTDTFVETACQHSGLNPLDDREQVNYALLSPWPTFS